MYPCVGTVVEACSRRGYVHHHWGYQIIICELCKTSQPFFVPSPSLYLSVCKDADMRHVTQSVVDVCGQIYEKRNERDSLFFGANFTSVYTRF